MNKEEFFKQLDGYRTDFTGEDLSGIDFRGSHLEGIKLNRANLDGANLSGVKMWWILMGGASLKNACMIGTELDGAELRQSDFYGADLTQASLCGACLYETKFNNATMTGADLQGANLFKTDFSGAILSGTSLDPSAPISLPSVLDLLEFGFEVDGEMVYGWRTTISQAFPEITYLSGTTCTAPVFSNDTKSVCHPGLHFGPKEVIENMFPGQSLVRCACIRSEMVKVGDVWRAKKLIIL
jgi:uncharacterized protein YjbI with pentapeptide repeats